MELMDNRTGAALAELPDRSAAYICGGKMSDEKLTSSTFRWFRGAWEPADVASEFPPRFHHSLVIRHGNVGFLFGGKCERALQNDLWLVDFNLVPLSYIRVRTKNPPRRRCGHSCAILPDSRQMLLVGGQSCQGELSDCHVLRLDTRRWSEVCTLPSPRAFHSMFALGGRLMHVFGGMIRGTPTDSILFCDAAQFCAANRGTKCWEELHTANPSEGPAPRAQSVALMLPNDRTVLVVGGCRRPVLGGFPRSTSDIFFMDRFALEWKRNPHSLSTARFGHCAFVTLIGAQWHLCTVGGGGSPEVVPLSCEVLPEGPEQSNAHFFIGNYFGIEVLRHPVASAYRTDATVAEQEEEEVPAAQKEASVSTETDSRERALAEKYLLPWLRKVRKRMATEESTNAEESENDSAGVENDEMPEDREKPEEAADAAEPSTPKSNECGADENEASCLLLQKDLSPLMKSRKHVQESSLYHAFCEVSPEPSERPPKKSKVSNTSEEQKPSSVRFMSLVPIPTIGTRRSIRARIWTM